VSASILGAARMDDQAVPAAFEELSETRDEPARRAPVDEAQLRDLGIVEQVRAGELAAFNRLVDLYQDYLFGVAYRILTDRDLASDAVQDAFLHAYQRLDGYRGGAFRSWLTRIGVNACMDILRAKRRRPSQPFPELDDESWEPRAPDDLEPEARAAASARSRALSAALALITQDQRVAIVLYDVEGFDYEEIAGMTGVSLGTVKSRIHRGRLALRDRLADRMDLFRG
jgi:RNA polymerase sigma-70 factor, ECF subfamily